MWTGTYFEKCIKTQCECYGILLSADTKNFVKSTSSNQSNMSWNDFTKYFEVRVNFSFFPHCATFSAMISLSLHFSTSKYIFYLEESSWPLNGINIILLKCVFIGRLKSLCKISLIFYKPYGWVNERSNFASNLEFVAFVCYIVSI